MGLQRLEADLEQHAAILDGRANLVDRFETRDAASIVQALLERLTPEQADQLGLATDGALGFLGDVRQAEDAFGQAKDSFFGDHPTLTGRRPWTQTSANRI